LLPWTTGRNQAVLQVFLVMKKGPGTGRRFQPPPRLFCRAWRKPMTLFQIGLMSANITKGRCPRRGAPAAETMTILGSNITEGLTFEGTLTKQ
jgi:hypothetical protein